MLPCSAVLVRSPGNRVETHCDSPQSGAAPSRAGRTCRATEVDLLILPAAHWGVLSACWRGLSLSSSPSRWSGWLLPVWKPCWGQEIPAWTSRPQLPSSSCCLSSWRGKSRLPACSIDIRRKVPLLSTPEGHHLVLLWQHLVKMNGGPGTPLWPQSRTWRPAAAPVPGPGGTATAPGGPHSRARCYFFYALICSGCL